MAEVLIVVPIYNVELYIVECLRSIQNQSFSDFVAILVDDGSLDESSKLAESFVKDDDRFIIVHQKNTGLSGARNIGIELGLLFEEAHWITFVDSDDWLDDHFLSTLYTLNIINNTSISMTAVINGDGTPTTSINEKQHSIKTPEELWITFSAQTAWGKLYKIEMFEKVRYPVGKIHEDEFVTYRLLFNEQYISLASRVLYGYRITPGSIMHSNWNVKKLDGLWAIAEQMIYFKKNKYLKALNFTKRKFACSMLYNLRLLKVDQNISSENKKAIFRKIGNFVARFYESSILDNYVTGVVYSQYIYLWRLCDVYWLAAKNKLKKIKD